MHFAEVINFTQLNLVQVAAQGYTAETEKKLSHDPNPADNQHGSVAEFEPFNREPGPRYLLDPAFSGSCRRHMGHRD